MTNNELEHQKQLEFKKLIFEFFKHLTTLNTAVAVIVPVVAQALVLHFSTSAVAMVCFVASAICCLLGMWITAKRVANDVNGAPMSLLRWAGYLIVGGVVYFTGGAIVERIWE